MIRQILPTLFVLSILLGNPSLGGSQQPDSSGSVTPANQTPAGSGPAPSIGQEPVRDWVQFAAQSGPADPAMGISAAKSAPADISEPLRAILAAKTVAVIGMQESGKKCARPPFPCAKRAKEQTEMSLRKSERFNLVEDPTKAELVIVAMESIHLYNEQETWAQLRVFK